MEKVLETKHLSKKYSNTTVLKDINMTIERGAIYGLIGKNGSGKTTIIRILCGLQKPTSGSYKIFDIDFEDDDITSSRMRMGAIVERPAIYSELSAYDNLKQEFKLIGNPELEEIDELLKTVGLENTGKKKAKHFSFGMKQRLGIAVALSNHPDFIILDEPINGLDPEGIVEIRELILNLNREENITFLVSSHYLDELSKIATHYGFLDNGLIIKEISSKDLSKKLEARIELEVSDPKEFVKYFEKNAIQYKVVDKNKINVYGKTNLSSFIAELAKHNLIADKIHENQETLESYYMNLIGGKIDD